MTNPELPPDPAPASGLQSGSEPAQEPPSVPDPMAESQLPPDPAAYDSERSVHARKRGLSAPYIPGGRDPNPEAGKAEERHYLRLLIAMVIILILAAFIVGLVATLLGFDLGATTE